MSNLPDPEMERAHKRDMACEHAVRAALVALTDLKAHNRAHHLHPDIDRLRSALVRVNARIVATWD